MISMRSVDLLSINLSPQLVQEFNRDFGRRKLALVRATTNPFNWWCVEQRLLWRML